MINKKNRDGIVYSTNPDFIYESSDAAEPDTLSPGEQKLYIRRESRNGKDVIVIKEFIGKSDDLKQLEKQIKNHCGTGGSSKDGDILIQGNHYDKIKTFLAQKGYKTKG